MNSKVRFTKGNIDKALDEIAEEINKLRDAISSTTEGSPKERENIRVVKKSDNTYSVEFKHKDGWVTTASSTIEFKES